MEHASRILLTSVMLSTCLKAAQAQTIDVVETRRTGGNPSTPFGTIGSMVEAAPGIVVISDDVTKSVYRWDLQSGRVSRLAREGRGPGEVLTPVALARRPGGGFALYDVAHAAVIFFDRDLGFERTVRPKGGFVSNPKSLAVLADGSFILSGGRLRDPRHLHRYAPSGDWVESFGNPSSGIESDNAKVQSAGGAVRALPRGFLFSYGAPLRILRFPFNEFAFPSILIEDLQLLPELTEDALHGPPQPQSRGARTFLWWHDRSTGVFALPDGRILNVVTRYHRGDSVWDLYAADGKRLAREVVPRAYYAWDLSPSGDVLASYRDPDTDEHIAIVLTVEFE